MNLETVKEKIINAKKGVFQNLKWQKELQLYKKYQNEDIKIIKISEGTIRFGIEYDNIKAVQNKRENGELPQDNQGLNGVEWILYPYILKGKNSIQLRVNTIKNCPIKSKYFMNGVEITKEQAQEYCTASNFGTHTNDLEVFNVKIDNIIELKEKTA